MVGEAAPPVERRRCGDGQRGSVMGMAVARALVTSGAPDGPRWRRDIGVGVEGERERERERVERGGGGG